MSILELEYPPILTPRLLNSLNGALEDSQRTALRSYLDLTLEECFKPFARYRGTQYAKRLHESVEKYQPYRLWIVAKLVEFLGKGFLQRLPGLAEERWGLSRGEDWTRLGVKPETINGIFASYGKAVKRLFSPPFAKAGWPGTPTRALRRLIDSFAWVASNLDFSVTSLCLIVDGELSAPPKAVTFLARAAKEAVRSFETHVETLCREPVKLEEYFYQLLHEQDLWTASEKKKESQAAGGFKPIEMAGKTLSQAILEDRR